MERFFTMQASMQWYSNDILDLFKVSANEVIGLLDHPKCTKSLYAINSYMFSTDSVSILKKDSENAISGIEFTPSEFSNLLINNIQLDSSLTLDDLRNILNSLGIPFKTNTLSSACLLYITLTDNIHAVFSNLHGLSSGAVEKICVVKNPSEIVDIRRPNNMTNIIRKHFSNTDDDNKIDTGTALALIAAIGVAAAVLLRPSKEYRTVDDAITDMTGSVNLGFPLCNLINEIIVLGTGNGTLPVDCFSSFIRREVLSDRSIRGDEASKIQHQLQVRENCIKMLANDIFSNSEETDVIGKVKSVESSMLWGAASTGFLEVANALAAGGAVGAKTAAAGGLTPVSVIAGVIVTILGLVSTLGYKISVDKLKKRDFLMKLKQDFLAIQKVEMLIVQEVPEYFTKEAHQKSTAYVLWYANTKRRDPEEEKQLAELRKENEEKRRARKEMKKEQIAEKENQYAK
ncbi:MAG: hypothetical protein MJZ34_03010 [Paludibacteraceae bacterium]|nr:hypothetical protein [Paludibacteraceae bacterium]